MLLCKKNYVIFFHWIVQSLNVSEPLVTSINTFRVNTHIISMPENTHDKLLLIGRGRYTEVATNEGSTVFTYSYQLALACLDTVALLNYCCW